MSKSEHIEGDSAYAPLSEVAAAYGVSVDTIRRRLRRGEIEGRRETTPQGFRWLAQLPSGNDDAIGASISTATQGIERAVQGELIATLQRELELRNQEIARLHTVVESQARAIEQTTAALSTLPSSVPGEDKSAQEEPVPTPETLEVTHGPQRPAKEPQAAESGMSAWERVRRRLFGPTRFKARGHALEGERNH
jgi:hypothetical protein